MVTLTINILHYQYIKSGIDFGQNTVNSEMLALVLFLRNLDNEKFIWKENTRKIVKSLY